MVEKPVMRWGALGVGATLAAPVLASSIGEGANLMANDWQSWAQGFGAAFLIVIGVGVLYDLSPLGQRPSNEPNNDILSGSESSDAVVRSPSLEGQLDEALLRRENYRYNPEADWWERPAAIEDAQFSETEIIAYDRDGAWLVSASVFEVLTECAWKTNSAAKFVYRNGAGCSLEKLLRNPLYQERLALSRHLVFFGMESYLNAPQPAGPDCHHRWLSECRADELAERTRNEVPENWPVEITFWTLDVGSATEENPKAEFDQRTALIIGVRNRRAELSTEEAISLLSKRTSVRGVRVRDYSKAEWAEPLPIEWVSGESSSEHR